jgi:PIN domain nuclease of toxin-antitoxin system
METVRYVLDACALIAFLNKEAGWDKVRSLLIEAVNTGKVEIYMNAVNLLEVYYDRLRLQDSKKLNKFRTWAFDGPIKIAYAFSRSELDEAARLKAVYKRISLADVLGLATAKRLGAAFVTSDHSEIAALEATEALDILWIRPPAAKE